jgi:NADPH:quinone reductase-like Zn-dependent oxidoreductase
MKAWELQDFGLEHLRLVEGPVPDPGPGQVLVRVSAAAFNSRDLQVIHDRYYPEQRLPIVPVSDGAGEIVALGPGVREHAVGDRVVGLFAQGWLAGERTWERWLTHLGGHLDGVLQEYVVLSAAGAVPVPSYLSDVEAAAATSAAATAWQALVELGRVAPGEQVLVQGTGGVAMFALQFAGLAGAHVIVTSSSDDKLERARRLGANVGVNYRVHPDWEEEVLRLTGGEGVDHVIEIAGDLERSISCLRVGGLVSLVGYAGQLDLASSPPTPLTYTASVITVLVRNARLQALSCAPRESWERMYRAMEGAELRPVIDRVFPFEQAIDALRHLSSGTHVGKVCIDVSGSASTGSCT